MGAVFIRVAWGRSDILAEVSFRWRDGQKSLLQQIANPINLSTYSYVSLYFPCTDVERRALSPDVTEERRH